MFSTPEQLAGVNKATVESMLTLANTAFASAERLAALNLNTARTMLEDSVANAKAMLAVKDLQELMSQPELGFGSGNGRFHLFDLEAELVGVEDAEQIAFGDLLSFLDRELLDFPLGLGPDIGLDGLDEPRDLRLIAVGRAFAAAEDTYLNYYEYDKGQIPDDFMHNRSLVSIYL